MGLFSKRNRGDSKASIAPAAASDTSSTPPVELPPPITVTSEDQSRKLLEEVGQMQQAISEGWRGADGAELEILPRLEGVLLYKLPTATYPSQAFDVLVAPISEWAMYQFATHPDFVSNPGSPEAQARLRLMNFCGEFRKKYQYLNPSNA